LLRGVQGRQERSPSLRRQVGENGLQANEIGIRHENLSGSVILAVSNPRCTSSKAGNLFFRCEVVTNCGTSVQALRIAAGVL
jgi:hypothetical protein